MKIPLYRWSIAALTFGLTSFAANALVEAVKFDFDKPGLVFPAFISKELVPSYVDSQNLGVTIAYMMRSAVQAKLAGEYDLAGELDFGEEGVPVLGVYLSEPSHYAAVQLARAKHVQGALWGFATPLLDGVAIHS